MITILKTTPADEISQYAGVYVESLTDTPPPGRLPVDGSFVKKSKFPNLFAKIGHLYTSGSLAGNGSEGDTFKLPAPTGRFLKPRDDGSLPGSLTEDRTSTHTHSVGADPASMPAHSASGVVSSGSQWSFTHNYEASTDGEISLRGTYTNSTYTSGYGGDHNHTFSLSNNAGVETRPYSARLPGWIISGETTSRCVAIIYGSDWGVMPGYNEVISAKTGLEVAFAKENVHSYRIRYPEAAPGKPTVATAHIEIARQLKKLRSMYADVWVIGIGVGAHLAAMAMTAPNLIWVATKFVGINGFYNPSGAYAASLTPSLTNYLGGPTQAQKDAGTPIKPYYPAKCWHGANNTVSPITQAQWFTDQVVSVPNLAWDANLVTAGLFADVLAFLESEA